MDEDRRFVKGHYYHICNKSIAGYRIFERETDAKRMVYAIDYYNSTEQVKSLSYCIKQDKYSYTNLLYIKDVSIVKIDAFCIMPDHYHLLMKILNPELVTSYIANLENSFTRYLNTRHERKGPLWQSRFRKRRIQTDDDLASVGRYIHLNPTTAFLVSKPEEWRYSSYRNYIDSPEAVRALCGISIKPEWYKSFCEDQIDYQRSIKKCKKLLLD